jgi:integrase
MKIQKIQRKTGHVYKVEAMLNYKRISKTFKSFDAAQEFMHQINANVQAVFNELNNLDIDPLEITFPKMVNEYLNSKHHNTAYKKSLLLFWSDTFSSYKTGEIQRKHIRQVLNKMAQTRKPATCNRYKSAISSLFCFLIDEYDIDFNPCAKIKGFKEDNARTTYLNELQLKHLLKACRQSKWNRLGLLALLAITTGARRGELIKLKWSDVDFNQRTILLEKTKNGSKRVLTLTNEVIKELSKFKKKTGYIFPSESKNSPEPYKKTFDHQWRTAMQQANLKGFRFHDLRHSCASFLAMKGATLLEIGDVLGHKSITMTQRYSHLCTAHKHKLTNQHLGNISLNFEENAQRMLSV